MKVPIWPSHLSAKPRLWLFQCKWILQNYVSDQPPPTAPTDCHEKRAIFLSHCLVARQILLIIFKANWNDGQWSRSMQFTYLQIRPTPQSAIDDVRESLPEGCAILSVHWFAPARKRTSKSASNSHQVWEVRYKLISTTFSPPDPCQRSQVTNCSR